MVRAVFGETAFASRYTPRESAGRHLPTDVQGRVRRADREDHIALPYERGQRAGIFQTGCLRALATRPTPSLGDPDHPGATCAQDLSDHAPHLSRVQQADPDLSHGCLLPGTDSGNACGHSTTKERRPVVVLPGRGVKRTSSRTTARVPGPSAGPWYLTQMCGGATVCHTYGSGMEGAAPARQRLPRRAHATRVPVASPSKVCDPKVRLIVGRYSLWVAPKNQGPREPPSGVTGRDEPTPDWRPPGRLYRKYLDRREVLA